MTISPIMSRKRIFLKYRLMSFLWMALFTKAEDALEITLFDELSDFDMLDLSFLTTRNSSNHARFAEKN
jgi:hypothetical protein